MADLISRLAGVSPALADTIRGHRPDVVEAADACHAAIFTLTPDDPVPGLDENARHLLALRTAAVEQHDESIAHYASRLEAAGLDAVVIEAAEAGPDSAAAAGLPPALLAAFRHVELLVTRAASTTQDDLRALLSVGFDEAEVVLISGIAAHVSYQVRAATGLSAIAAHADSLPGALPTATPSVPGFDREPRVAELAPGVGPHFTTDERAWHAWIKPVGPDTGSPAQIEAYETSVWPNSPYFRLLAWHPASLAARTTLDRAIFLGRPGIGRGERELAATATSRVNGCELCASVHARFTITFSKQPDPVNRLLTEGVTTPLEPRWRAIVDASSALAQVPARLEAHHVGALRREGLSDADIHDVVQSAAFFAWANRLMLSLGAPLPPGADDASALADQQSADARAAEQV